MSKPAKTALQAAIAQPVPPSPCARPIGAPGPHSGPLKAIADPDQKSIEPPSLECEACAKAALNPYSGLTYANCLGCSVRSVSSWSSANRQEFYAGIADRESREEFVDAVNVEYARRLRLVAKLGETGV